MAVVLWLNEPSVNLPVNWTELPETVVPQPSARLTFISLVVLTTAYVPAEIVACLVAVNHATDPAIEAAVEKAITAIAGTIILDFFIFYSL